MACRIDKSNKMALLSFCEDGSVHMWDIADQLKFPRQLWCIKSFEGSPLSISHIRSTEPKKGSFIFNTSSGVQGTILLQRKFEFKNSVELETSELNPQVKKFLKGVSHESLLEVLSMFEKKLISADSVEKLFQTESLKDLLIQRIDWTCDQIFNDSPKNKDNISFGDVNNQTMIASFGNCVGIVDLQLNQVIDSRNMISTVKDCGLFQYNNLQLLYILKGKNLLVGN